MECSASWVDVQPRREGVPAASIGLKLSPLMYHFSCANVNCRRNTKRDRWCCTPTRNVMLACVLHSDLHMRVVLAATECLGVPKLAWQRLCLRCCGAQCVARVSDHGMEGPTVCTTVGQGSFRKQCPVCAQPIQSHS